MQKDLHIVYSEVQKLNLKKWVFIPMGIAMGLLVLLLAVPMLYFYFTGGVEVMNEFFTVPFVAVTLIGGLIPCTIIYFNRTRMRLDLKVTPQGLYYTFKNFSTPKEKFLAWDEATVIEVKRYPFAATRPGEQNKIYTKGQEVFVMTTDLVGIEIKLNDGKYKFFTSIDPDALIKAIKTLNLNLQITK